MNKLHIIGNLTRDPEVKYTQTGTACGNFSIAVNETYTQNGEKKENVYFFNCESWSKLAEIIVQYFKKGDRIGITGKLKQERWEDQDGKARSNVKIVVQEIDFLQGKKEFVENNNQSPVSDDSEIPF